MNAPKIPRPATAYRDEAERKVALRLQVASASAAARAVFAADKVSKARELRQRAARGALSAHDQLELEHYRESFDVLAALTPEDALVRRLGRELEALRTMPDGKGTG